MTRPEWHISLDDARGKLPAGDQLPFALVLRHGSMLTGLYAPRGTDSQEPHGQDELYIVATGRGTFVRDGEPVGFTAGDILFVPAGMDHRFVDFTDDLAVWVVFYGPQGGEQGAPH